MPRKDKQDQPDGLALLKTLKAQRSPINRLAWSPDGQLLATPSANGTIYIWDLEATEDPETVLAGHEGPVNSVAWTPTGLTLASASDDGSVRLWDPVSAKENQRLEAGEAAAGQVAWSLSGENLAASYADGRVRIWDAVWGAPVKTLWPRSGKIPGIAWSPDGLQLVSAGYRGTVLLSSIVGSKHETLRGEHSGEALVVAWSPKGDLIASGSVDNTIRVWSVSAKPRRYVLEGHTGPVTCVAFSADGRFLASKSGDDTIRLWRCGTWDVVAILREPSDGYLFRGLAFHPRSAILASLGGRDRPIRIWALDEPLTSSKGVPRSSFHYLNAKVFLVGDTGVGKTGLALALTGQKFKATTSTHGRHVWRLEKSEVQRHDHFQLRETLLWDLAGQPGYRLTHQLHLGDVAVALVVFDARSETDPFAGVRHWVRAIRQAVRVQDDSSQVLITLLVAARTDRGGVAVSRARIEAMQQELGFDGYFETSAKEGWGIPELIDAIKASIDWRALPTISSTALFQTIKEFLAEEKKSGRVLARADELFRALTKAHTELLASVEDLREQFDACLGRVGAAGLVRSLSFGGLVLMQPELLDAYASAIVNAARDEPDGFGCIDEEDVLGGRFRMSEEERVHPGTDEELLLISTVEEMLRHEIALRETTETGSILVFPSQFTREWPEAPDPPGKAHVFSFEGSIQSIYATLAVRLSRCGFFERDEMWRNAATFAASLGGRCGIWLRQLEEARAELFLFYDKHVVSATRQQFQTYIENHLLGRSVAGTVFGHPLVFCTECGEAVPERYVRRRLEKGLGWISCGVCENRIALAPSTAVEEVTPDAVLERMDLAADRGRDKEMVRTVLRGKLATNDYDVFLAHNSLDREEVVALATALRRRGLNPWLDIERVAPGRWFQDVISAAIPQVKSAAVVIGSSGLGRWQALELRSFISRCVDAGLPVIPVLLEGVTEVPSDLAFLKELSSVVLSKGVEDPDGLDALEWGITGRQPRRYSRQDFAEKPGESGQSA